MSPDHGTTGDGDNLKALYRRGQAFLGLRRWVAASSDLDRAVKLSAGDPSQQRLIKEKLQEAKDQIGVMRANGTLKGKNCGLKFLGSTSFVFNWGFLLPCR